MCLCRAFTGLLLTSAILNRFPRPMRKAINTQKMNPLEGPLIIIGLQRYYFFSIPQVFFAIFFFSSRN